MDTLSRAIPGMLAPMIRKAPLTPEKVAFAWRMAVGPEIARSTTVRLGDDGVLQVQADPHWAAEVRRARTLIVPRLAAFLGDGTVRRLQTPPPPEGRRRPPKRRP
ncbi:MAG: DUF721 domain-containing protein [Vicinamibacterales bacterium]